MYRKVTIILLLIVMVVVLITDFGLAVHDDGGGYGGGEGGGDEDSCPPHDNETSYGPWEHNSSQHWRYVSVYCTKCGAHREYKESGSHSLSSKKEIKHKSRSSCRGTITKSCNACGYSTSSSFSNNHSRGSTCSTCGTYYPTHEEEANGYIEESNDESKEGENIQEGAETNETNAEDNLNEGEDNYENANNEYNSGNDNLDNAAGENTNSEGSLEQSNNELENGANENENSAQTNENAQENKEDSINSEDESKEKYGEVEEGQQNASEKKNEVDDAVEKNQDQEDLNNENIDEENTINESGEAGDPVKYTTGEYVSKSIDIKINNLNPPMNIIRNYRNFKKNSFSFGKGWKFNYDTRIIHGVRADYIYYQENLKTLLSEIEVIYEEASKDYQSALEAAKESKRLAELSVAEAVKAVNHAENAKKAAENAELYANTANTEAIQAEKYANDALENIKKSREYAITAIDLGIISEGYAIEAKNSAENADDKAKKAITLANSAIYHAEQADDQTLINIAHDALERAETLKDRVNTTLSNLNGSQGQSGIITAAESLQLDSQKILDNIIENELENKIDIEINNAERNKTTAESKIIEAEELYVLAENTYQSALETKIETDNRLAESNSWLASLKDNIILIEQIEAWKEDIAKLAKQAEFDREYSETYRYRNQFNVDWNANPIRDEIGIGKLILVDEEGTPHIYNILTEPDFKTEEILPDGSKNYYPNGSETEAVNPIDDRVKLMPDGSYLLTKKGGTKYVYSYYGQLIRIEDTNNCYLDFTYNTEHQLMKISDGFERELLIERSNGKIIKITDPLGREYKYNYNGDRLTAFTDPEGNIRNYTYSQAGMTELIYPDGSGWKYYYTELDGQMVIDYQEDSSGAIIDFEYNPIAQQTTVTDRRGNKTTYRYNENHLTEEEIEPGYQKVQKRYDSNNNLISITNQRGYTTSYTYDQNNNITSVTDPVGTTSFSYNQFNKISSVTDKNGHTTSYYYDSRGNLTSINYPDGSKRTFTYNDQGLLISETDQRGNRTDYTFDQYGNLKEKIYPDGSIERYQYDRVGRLIKKTKANGGEITYHYDNNDNITSVTDELGNQEIFVYNSRDKIIERTDPNGNITKYEYDQRNNLKKIIDPAGNIQEIEYDEAENMTRKLLAENVSYIYKYDNLDRLISATQVETDIKTSYQYDPTGNLTALTDGEGRTTKYEYDAINRKIREIDPLYNKISYNYYPDNQLKSVIDKNGNTTYFKYDTMGRLIEVINPLGRKVKYKYDAAGNLTAKIDALGNTTRYQYDCRNRMTRKIDSLANETLYEYDQSGNLISLTDPEGNTTGFEYDLKGRLIKETNSLGDSKLYQYDAAGNLIAQTNEAGITTKYSYDQLNRLVGIEDVLGNKTKIGYTSLSKIAWREDALGNRIEFEYDSAGRLIKETDPEGNIIEYTYDKAGNLIAEKDQLGNKTEYSYDQLNRMIEIVDALNNRVQYSYDASGNLTEMVNQNGSKYHYQYDALDRLVKEINYQGNEQSYSYDPNGNLKAKTDFNGNTINYDYDQLNRLLKVIFADDSKKEFSYNANGKMTAAVNNNSSQKYYFDKLSRLIKVEVENEDGEEYTVDYEYNKISQRTKVTLDDGSILKDRETKYEYDEAMRLSKVELPDGEMVKYKYDELNRIITQINSNNTGTNYTYTPDGQVETITHFKGLNGYGHILQSYSYIYNARNQRVLQVEGSGQLQAYEYDPVGRLTKVYYPFSDQKKAEDLKERFYYGLEPEWSEPFGFQLKLNNQLNWNQENNLKEQITALTDEVDGSLVGMPIETNSNSNDNGKKEKGNKVANPEELILKPGKGSLTFADSLDLSYDLQNKAEELYSDIRQNSNSLDIYGDNYWVEEFSYDPAGNVTQKSNGWGAIEYQYNSANQLVKAGERRYQHDNNGNLVQEELGKYQASYQYNYENRLISAVNNNHPHFFNGSKPFKGEVTYIYDALGRKANKQVDQLHGNKVDVSSYIYDGRGINILAEYQVEVNSNDNHGNKHKKPHNKGKLDYYNEYYYGHSLIAMNYLKHPDKGTVHSNVSFYHQDSLGSASMITGKNGQVVDRYQYDAYGNPYSGRFEQGNNMNPYGFTGQRFEAELGVYAFAYRTYNPRSMRWMTVDPVKDGMNWYAYVNGDPINYIDPDGRIIITATTAATVAVAGAVGTTLAVVTNPEVREGIADALYEGGKALSDAVQNISRQKEGDVALEEVLPNEDPITGLDVNTGRRLSGGNGSSDPNNKDKKTLKEKVIKGSVIVGMVATAAKNLIGYFIDDKPEG